MLSAQRHNYVNMRCFSMYHILLLLNNTHAHIHMCTYIGVHTLCVHTCIHTCGCVHPCALFWYVLLPDAYHCIHELAI